MWFGDLVTMRWFNDVWMKEVFANFMAAKIVNPSFPEVNHDLRFLYAHYPAAYEVDRTAGTNAIRQPLDNLSEAGSLYGAIIYQKAPIVMRHLEQVLGVESFRDGLREYLKAHAFGNATWSDLIAVLDARTPTDLAAWSQVWVDSPGRPTIAVQLDVHGGRISRLAFAQADGRGRDLVWPQQLRVVVDQPDGPRTVTVALNGDRASAAEVIGLAGAPLRAADRRRLGLRRLRARSDVARVSVSLGGRDRRSADPRRRVGHPVGVDARRHRPGDDVRGHRARLGAEGARRAEPPADPELRRRRLVAAPERHRAQGARGGAEAVLRAGLDAATTPSQKAAWFGALRRLATTPPTLAWLSKVWDKSETITGLPLAETDYSALALDLAVREVANWPAILDGQLARIENPDRKARFQFIMPALSADAAVRDRWFQSLKDVANRRREPWVLDGLEYLHHPLRAAASAKYVRPSLDLLWEIQRTGDIFFPKRWMDATLGGYRAPFVATTVRDFLAAAPPSYPPRLTNIVLQSADELFRTADRQ